MNGASLPHIIHARHSSLRVGISFILLDGIEATLEMARKAASDKDISLGGGAKTAQQYLTVGLVNEMVISLVRTLLGSGERLFEGVGDNLHGLELMQTIAAPKIREAIQRIRGRSSLIFCYVF